MSARDELARHAEAFDLDAVYAFGSRAKEAHEFVVRGAPFGGDRGSDVDIGVLPAVGTRLDARQRVDLVIRLEQLFGGATVDLVVLPEAAPLLARDVVSGELLTTRNPDREAEYQLHALRRAADLAHFERERQAIILRGGR